MGKNFSTLKDPNINQDVALMAMLQELESEQSMNCAHEVHCVTIMGSVVCSDILYMADHTDVMQEQG